MLADWIPELSFIVGCCLLPIGFVAFAVLLWRFEVNEKKKRRKRHELSDSFVMPITEATDKIRRELKKAEKAYEEVDIHLPLDLFLQVAAGSNAWKFKLEQTVITKKAQKKRLRYWGLFVLLMGLFWPWVSVIYWMILPFSKYAALSAGFFVACCIFVFLFAVVNSLLTPPPYEPGWIWAVSLLIGPLIGWILIFFGTNKSLSADLFLAHQQLTFLHYGVTFAVGTVWVLLVFIDGRKHAHWYGRSMPEHLSSYTVLGIFGSVFLLLFSLSMLKKPIIIEPNVFEWGVVVSMIKVFSLQGVALGLIFGQFVLNMNGFKPKLEISTS